MINLNLRQAVIKSIQRQAIEATKDWKEIGIDIADPQLNPMMNNRCQFNALNEYRAKRAVAILEVFNFRSDSPIAHYISINDQGQTYDATLGWSWSGAKYRLSRYVHTMDVDDMSKHLTDFKKKLMNMSDKKTLALAKVLMIDEYDCF